MTYNFYEISSFLIKKIKQNYVYPILSLENNFFYDKKIYKILSYYLEFIEEGKFTQNNFIKIQTLEEYKPVLISLVKEYLNQNKQKRKPKRRRINKKQNFLEGSSIVIAKIYKELKSFSEMHNFDIDYTQYRDLIEINISCESLLIASINNRFNELELMFQLLATIYYLNSDKFKKDFLNITTYREKIFKCEYYNLKKVVNETIFFQDGEWVDYTKRIKIKIEEPNNTPYMDIGYPILRTLIQLYVLP